MKKGAWSISILCFSLSIILWIPNVFLSISSGAWIFTFIAGPPGAASALIAKSKWLIIGNLLMSISFFWLMAIFQVIEGIGYYFF
ncbi:hypothetical protein [Halobacillus kuroshimensis]|uniref:hypothetical protein n=1 Tax=Halobacillus kuroshimensis TaxID=302481 RepID=UPI0003F787B4|nr:hypothetical protein [Halobacillus kuroshimensis]